jgi:mannan endo-1,4-beta-mannosidase
MDQGVKAVEAANRIYIAGEIDWTGLNGGTQLQGDSLASFTDYILKRQSTSKPTVSGSLIWSLFGRNVPDCSVSSHLSFYAPSECLTN